MGYDEALDLRVETLERHNRQLKTFGVIGLVGLGIVLIAIQGQVLALQRPVAQPTILTQPPPQSISTGTVTADEIQAKRIFVMNPKSGTASLVLMTSADGDPIIQLVDRGIVRVAMNLNRGDPSLSMYSKVGTKWVEIGELHDGTSGIVAVYGSDKRSISLSRSVQFTDRQENLRIDLGLFEGDPSFNVFSQDRKRRVAIGESKGTIGFVNAFASDGSGVLIGASPDGPPALFIVDKNGNYLSSFPPGDGRQQPNPGR